MTSHDSAPYAADATTDNCAVWPSRDTDEEKVVRLLEQDVAKLMACAVRTTVASAGIAVGSIEHVTAKTAVASTSTGTADAMLHTGAE